MSIKISFKKSKLERTSANLVLFVDERFNIRPIKRYISSLEYTYISDLLKSSDLKKKLLVFNLTSKKKNSFSIHKKKHQKFRDRKFRGRTLWNC